MRLGFPNCLAIDSVGKSGGITLLWRANVDLKIVNYSRSHIHAKIVWGGNQQSEGYFTRVYGNLETSLRGVTWRLIKELCIGDGKAWLVCGDFNERLLQNENKGGKRRPEL